MAKSWLQAPSPFNGIAIGRIIRLNSNGSRDATFNSVCVVNNIVYAVAQQTDGKTILAGSFTKYNTTLQIE
jgi:hypothetical protein